TSLLVGPAGLGAGGIVADVSFIPQYRDVRGVTGTNRWCVDWSRRRDLALAGRPAEALAGFPRSFEDLRPNPVPNGRTLPCVSEQDTAVLGAVLAAEAGDL